MGKTILYILIAYLSGSVLYANVFGDLFGVRERYAESADKNPGTTNAFTYGGFWCGVLTLVFELAKGAVPVYLFLRSGGSAHGPELFLVLAAPVVGHVLPIFYGFHGGKGIAVTFGSLLGLFPYLRPVLIFAAVFVFLSVVVKISPHFYRTIASYVMTCAMMLPARIDPTVHLSFLFMAAIVCLRMYLGHEEKERLEVKLLWMR